MRYGARSHLFLFEEFKLLKSPARPIPAAAQASAKSIPHFFYRKTDHGPFAVHLCKKRLSAALPAFPERPPIGARLRGMECRMQCAGKLL